MYVIYGQSQQSNSNRKIPPKNSFPSKKEINKAKIPAKSIQPCKKQKESRPEGSVKKFT